VKQKSLQYCIFLLFRPSEDSLQQSAILDGSPSKDWQSTVTWGDCWIRTPLLFHNLVSLPMSHHCSLRTTTALYEPPPLSGEQPLLPMSHHCSLFHSLYHYFNYPLGNSLASPVLPCCNPRCSMILSTYVYAILP
jgi:hypothetical protein